VRFGGVNRGQPLFEFVHRDAALGQRAVEHLRHPLAVCIGSAHLAAVGKPRLFGHRRSVAL
jgi:hypothetical protein